MCRTLIAFVAVLALTVGMTACKGETTSEKVSGAVETAGEATGDAVKTAGNAVGDAAKATGDAIEDTTK